MSDVPSVESAVRQRRYRLVERHVRPFGAALLRAGLEARIHEDPQLTRLLAIAVHVRRVTGRRGVGSDGEDPLSTPLLALTDRVDEAIHRRAIELAAEVCAAFLAGTSDWFDLPEDDDIDATVIQECLDAQMGAQRWLDTHELVVGHLDLPEPPDEAIDRLAEPTTHDN